MFDAAGGQCRVAYSVQLFHNNYKASSGELHGRREHKQAAALWWLLLTEYVEHLPDANHKVTLCAGNAAGEQVYNCC